MLATSDSNIQYEAGHAAGCITCRLHDLHDLHGLQVMQVMQAMQVILYLPSPNSYRYSIYILEI